MTNTYQLPISDTLGAAWHKVAGSKKSFWAALGIMFAIMFCFGLAEGLSEAMNATLFQVMKFLGRVISYFLQLGLLYMGICRAKDKPLRYDLVFSTFTIDQAFRIIGLYLLEFILFIIPAVLILAGATFYGMAFVGSAILGSVFVVSGVIAIIMIAVRLMLSVGLVLDQAMGPWSAIKTSFKLTQGNTLRLITLVIIQLAIVAISAIPLGLGLIWTIPFSLIGYGVIYQRLTAHQNA